MLIVGFKTYYDTTNNFDVRKCVYYYEETKYCK